MKKLKQDWQGRGFFGRVASWMNEVAFQINNASVVTGGRVSQTALGLQIAVSSTGSGSYTGELWIMGYHLFDSANFSPTNTNGTAISGTYSGATWIEIDISGATPIAAYRTSGPAGATFGDNKTWRRIAECGGSGQYIMC